MARKQDPELWVRAKEKACKEAGLCLHSARKMQWAVRYYKQSGGRFSGKRSQKNSLVRWSRQKWKTKDGSKSDGRIRYLPAQAWAHLSPSQVRRTNKAKSLGYARGQQYVKQPDDVVKIVKRFR